MSITLHRWPTGRCVLAQFVKYAHRMGALIRHKNLPAHGIYCHTRPEVGMLGVCDPSETGVASHVGSDLADTEGEQRRSARLFHDGEGKVHDGNAGDVVGGINNNRGPRVACHAESDA